MTGFDIMISLLRRLVIKQAISKRTAYLWRCLVRLVNFRPDISWSFVKGLCYMAGSWKAPGGIFNYQENVLRGAAKVPCKAGLGDVLFFKGRFDLIRSHVCWFHV